MKMKKLVSAIAALAMSVSAFAGLTAYADETYTLTSVKSAQTDGSTMTDGTTLTALSANNTQFRDWNSGSDGSVKFNSGGTVSFYQFDISAIEGNVSSATLTVNVTGTGDGKNSYNIRLLGYNGTLDTLSNSGSKETLTGTVSGEGSFQPLDTTTSYTTGTTFPVDFDADATKYVASAVAADNSTVTFAMTVNLGRAVKSELTAALEIKTVEAATYTVKYDVNGNETSETVIEGSSPVELPATPAYVSVADKAEYTFASWSDGTNTYSSDEVKALAISSDVTFTAVYAPTSWIDDVFYQNTVAPVSYSNTRSATYTIGAEVDDDYEINYVSAPTKNCTDSDTTYFAELFLNESSAVVAGMVYYGADNALYFTTTGANFSNGGNGQWTPELAGENAVLISATRPETDTNVVITVDETAKTATLSYGGAEYTLPLVNTATSISAIKYGGYRYNGGTISNIYIKDVTIEAAPTEYTADVEVVNTYVDGTTTEDGKTIVGNATALTATFNADGGSFNTLTFTVTVDDKEKSTTETLDTTFSDEGYVVYGIVIENAIVTEDAVTAVATLVE